MSVVKAFLHRPDPSDAEPKMSEIVVIGGGGHAKVIIGALKRNGFHIHGYTDVEDRGGILGVAYLGKDIVLEDFVKTHESAGAVIGIGKVDASIFRLDLQNKLATLGFGFPVICSPHAIVGEEVIVGAGTVVLDRVVINSGTVIGKACILNTGSIVEHDCRLGENVHVAPGATISGGAIIGDHCMIGVGANVIQSLRICQGTLIGAGSTVIADITIPGTYFGSPAKMIR
jgi:sugar O-acyltransferase (sialic acid O-acetyltransferase NeuD family)